MATKDHPFYTDKAFWNAKPAQDRYIDACNLFLQADSKEARCEAQAAVRDALRDMGVDEVPAEYQY